MDASSHLLRRLFHKIPPVDIQFNTANICNGTITAVTTPVATTYNWSASQSGSLTNPGNGATVTVNPGTWMLRVTTDAPGGSCPGRDSTTVTIDNYTPAFTQSDACQDQVTLTATPAGSYTYRWFRNNVQIPGGRVITASAADDNVAYFVRVVSTLNGCIKQSPTANVQVDGASNGFPYYDNAL